MEPKQLHPGVVLENGATLEGGAVFSLIIMFEKNSTTLQSGTKTVPKWGSSCGHEPFLSVYISNRQ